jgi:ubiquinone/menaquinone biosynthesis C-methylase UbiE
VFDLLAATPNLNSTEMGASLKLEPQPLRILLSGMVALKLLSTSNGTYRNDPLAEQTLGSRSPRGMVPVLRWIKYGINVGLSDLTESIRQNRNVGVERFAGSGTTIYQRLEADPALDRIFHESLRMFARAAPVILSQVEAFGRLSHLLDVGGGDGTHAISLARAFPSLRITIFDSPTVCKVADAHVAEAGLSDRIDTHAGNFFTDPFPLGADGVFMSELTPIWSPDRNKDLFRRAFKMLPRRGALVILSVMMNDDETGPVGAALFSPYFLAIASGEGMAYPASDYRAWLTETGFSEVQTIPTGLPLNQKIVVGIR